MPHLINTSQSGVVFLYSRFIHQYSICFHFTVKIYYYLDGYYTEAAVPTTKQFTVFTEKKAYYTKFTLLTNSF